MWESLTDDEIQRRLDAAGRPDVLLCTHTGLHWQGRVGSSLVVNVGAIGRPANDGRQEVWYALLDVDREEARAQFVPELRLARAGSVDARGWSSRAVRGDD